MSLAPAYTPLNWVNLNPGAAAVTILNQPRTGEQSRVLQGLIVVTGLSGAGSLLTVTRSVGGVAQIAVPFTVPIGQTSIEIPLAPFVARDALAVSITLRSDNAADSSVSGSTTLWPGADAREIAGVIIAEGGGEKAPFLNRKVDHDKVINLSSRDDGYIIDRPVRLTVGSKETWWLRRTSGEPWYAIQSVPVSSDATHVAVIDQEEGESAWGVKDEYVGVTVQAPSDTAEKGDEATVTLRLEPEKGRVSVVEVACSVL